MVHTWPWPTLVFSVVILCSETSSTMVHNNQNQKKYLQIFPAAEIESTPFAFELDNRPPCYRGHHLKYIYLFMYKMHII